MTTTRRSRRGWRRRCGGGAAGSGTGRCRRRAGSRRPGSGSAPSRWLRCSAQVAVPVADLDTAGAFLGPWRLMSVDGMEWDVPDTAANRARVRVAGRPGGPGGVPEDQGGDGQRVRLARGGGGRGGPGGGREGQRGAGAGPAAVPGPGGGLAAARGPELLLLHGLVRGGRRPGRRCCGGSGPAWRLPVLEAAAGRVLAVGAGQPARSIRGRRRRRDLLAAGRPGRGPGPRTGPATSGPSSTRSATGTATARTSGSS